MARSRLQLADGWSLKQQDSDEWLPVAKVPSQVHVDLLANKKIPDPFLDLNERAVQWVGEKVWVYRVSFQAPHRSGENGPLIADLVFEGLDTFATVTLNGKKVLTADNMFVSYRVNVTEHIKAHDNVLEIVFDSALLRGRELVKEHGHEHDFLVRQTEAGRLAIRKAQYNWGWDWGPILMTAGPWKPVYLEQYEARIDDFWASSEVSEDLSTCSGQINVKVDGEIPKGASVAVSLSKDDVVVFKGEASASTSSGNGAVSIPFRIEKPELWYPLGYGSPSRYKLEANLVYGGDNDVRHTLDSQSKLTGFRRTELVQESDADGKSFYLRINNVDVFSGGSCWVPADSFLAQIPAQRYHDWIRLAARGNQNMVRVWGGGVYEDDALFDACDELGVMIWQDFQFACGSYPTYKSYLDSFEHEARQQIRRVRWRPSMIIWAGNNEDYQVQERYKLDYDFEDKKPENWLKSTFPARYIYEHLLPELVKEEDPLMIYHPSSPWGDGKDTADPTVGDIHQWNIWHGEMHKYQQAPTLGGRFVSEFGMVAYPHLETVHRAVTDPSQRYPGSMAMDAHNKAIGHERRMMTYVAENFRLRTVDLPTYVHLSQVMQAECMRACYKAWRRDWGRPGSRRCGGVLVWQINDCWPTMSWGVVDYYLVPKPAFYAMRRALQPLDVGVARTFHDWTQTGSWVDEHSQLVTGQVDHTLPARQCSFDVWIASSSGSKEEIQAEVQVRFISVKSGRDVADPIAKKSVSAIPNSTTDVIRDQEAPTSIPNPEDRTQAFDTKLYDPYVIHVALRVDGNVVATDTAWPEPIKYLDLSERGITVEVAPSGDSVVVSALKPVKGFVFEEVEGLTLSDNGFDLIPGEKVTVSVQGSQTADQLGWTYVGAP